MKKNQNLFLSIIVFIGLILCVGYSSIYAQEISKNDKQQLFWFNGGIGGSSWGLLTMGINGSYQTGNNLFSLHCIAAEELDISGYGETDWGGILGVLYGRVARTKDFFASISAGISLVRRIKEEEELRIVGIPILGQLFLTPLPYLGFGICPFTNLNLKDIPVGLLLCVQIGARK